MGKVIITGPGRSGTTFLVQLLTRLGYDTGYEPYKEPYLPSKRAGCEHRLQFDLAGTPERARRILETAPRVLKSPEWALVLKGFARLDIMQVDHVFIPVRDLDEAAQSRLDVQLDWQVCSTDDYSYRVMDQASVHALALGRAIEACLMCDIPYTIMLFPRLVEDPDYCRAKLSEGLSIDPVRFQGIFAELANPKQVVWRGDGRKECGKDDS